ncbi:cytochrome C assembly family protein, partial [Vibrio parahaemolyticus VPTS-2010]
ERCGGTCSW